MASGEWQGDFSRTLNTAEVYNIVGNSWLPIKSMLYGRSGHTTVTYEGEIFSIEGSTGWMNNTMVEKYKPEEDAWSCVGFLMTARTGACAVIVDNNLWRSGQKGYPG